jgi:uncharacterized protein YbbC (DUF1343 family)
MEINSLFDETAKLQNIQLTNEIKELFYHQQQLLFLLHSPQIPRIQTNANLISTFTVLPNPSP